jgi:hypothetical protein
MWRGHSTRFLFPAAKRRRFSSRGNCIVVTTSRSLFSSSTVLSWEIHRNELTTRKHWPKGPQSVDTRTHRWHIFVKLFHLFRDVLYPWFVMFVDSVASLVCYQFECQLERCKYLEGLDLATPETKCSSCWSLLFHGRNLGRILWVILLIQETPEQKIEQQICPRNTSCEPNFSDTMVAMLAQAVPPSNMPRFSASQPKFFSK